MMEANRELALKAKVYQQIRLVIQPERVINNDESDLSRSDEAHCSVVDSDQSLYIETRKIRFRKSYMDMKVAFFFFFCRHQKSNYNLSLVPPAPCDVQKIERSRDDLFSVC